METKLCPKCDAPINEREKVCPYCGYEFKSQEDYSTKEEFNKSYIYDVSNQATGLTLWLGILDITANITIALGIIASIALGIFLMAEEELVLVGILIIVVGSLISVISSAGIKALIGVAKDIHFIREKHE